MLLYTGWSLIPTIAGHAKLQTIGAMYRNCTFLVKFISLKHK